MRGLQRLVELVVGGELALQVGELLALGQELFEGLYLLGNLVGCEVLEALELQADTELPTLVAQLVVDRVGELRIRRLQHFVKILRTNLDELAILELRELGGAIPAEVGQDPHDEGDLLLYDRVTDVHVV